jgi:phage baseplate assembly protein W
MAQAKKTYDFKSVGQLQSKYQNQITDTTPKNPIGILTPVSFDQTGGSLFRMSTELEDQVRDNLRNLLSTNHGERLMLNDFGANLKELAYDLTSEDVISEALIRINQAVSKFMPFVTLETFESEVIRNDDESSALAKIRVGYSVPAAGAINQQVEVAIVVTS